MKKCMLTTAIGKDYENLLSITKPKMIQYCEKYGYDLIVKTELGNHVHPAFVRFDCKELLEEYDYVMYLDTDVYIKDNSPDIIEKTKHYNVDIIAYDEGVGDQRTKINDRLSRYLIKSGMSTLKPVPVGRSYYNSGCCIYSKGFLKYFDLNIPEIILGCNDQEPLNLAILNEKITAHYKHGFGELFHASSYADCFQFVHFYGKPYGEGKCKLIKMFDEGVKMSIIKETKNLLKREEEYRDLQRSLIPKGEEK